MEILQADLKYVLSGNSKILRSINRTIILNIIRERQPISRANIAKITGLNKSTISSIVAELLNEDLIYEEIFIDNGVGRNPYNLYLKLGKHYVGAINIDSSITRFAVADIDGSIKGESSILTENIDKYKFMEKCINELLKLSSELGINNLKGIGITIAGIVDSENLIVKFAPNLGWEDFNIGEIIKKLTPEVDIIAVGNDAKASALAELWFGTHNINLSNFVFLSIGPGIGSGVILDNKLLKGGNEASGEFGHMTLIEGGNLCVCGNYGCWEAYASDRATVQRYLIRKKMNALENIDFAIDNILSLAENEDEIAIETLKQTGYYLGLGISNIIKALDPQAIIIGGRITKAWNLIYPEIMNVIKQRAFFNKKNEHLIILPTSLKVRPRLLGAATLAIKELFDGYKIIL